MHVDNITILTAIPPPPDFNLPLNLRPEKQRVVHIS